MRSFEIHVESTNDLTWNVYAPKRARRNYNLQNNDGRFASFGYSAFVLVVQKTYKVHSYKSKKKL